MKYVLVTGDAVSGVGKGTTACGVAVLLKGYGLRVTLIKIDPFLNTDAGTMSPLHDQMFVLGNGGEVDFVLGNYERFLDIKLTRDNIISTGKIYQSVIDKERKGHYLGRTVQVVPHVTDEIQDWIERVAMNPVDGTEEPADVCVIEFGGVRGTIESLPFIEALGELSLSAGHGNFCVVHLLTPVLDHSAHGPSEFGWLRPDILACRSTRPMENHEKLKVSQLYHVPMSNIVSLHHVTNIWHIPLLLKDQKVHEVIANVLHLQGVGEVPCEPKVTEWTERAIELDKVKIPVKIAIVGNFTGLSDPYMSVLKALLHASVSLDRKLVVNQVPCWDLEILAATERPDAYREAWSLLKDADGVIVPGGSGGRGVEGKILAAKHARENNVPYLGICLGMQVAVIEFARSVMNLCGAHSTEFDPDTKVACVISMPEGSKTLMGAAMRFGSRNTFFQVNSSISAKLYANASCVNERHRHKYEVNPHMVPKFEMAGLSFVGMDKSGRRMDIIELPTHKFFVGTQFQPEFNSTSGKPSPLFLGLIAASSGQLDHLLQHSSGVICGQVTKSLDFGFGQISASMELHDAPKTSMARGLTYSYEI